MAPKLIDRTEPTVIPRTHAPMRSRLPPVLRVPILFVLNLGISTLLWSLASNFLNPELGAISRVPNDDDLVSLYSPLARLAMRLATIWMTWYFNYDVYDVATLTVLMHAPFAYLLSTYYEITTLTIAAHVSIEVISMALPTLLLRKSNIIHEPSAPLRNRFLLNSVQVQSSNSLLAISVYITTIWAGLKTGYLNLFLISFFDIPTLETAHREDPVAILTKVFIAGICAKEFLLNPSIAAQPASGGATPAEQFDPAIATLDQTIKANVFPAEKRTRTLAQQVLILNAFVFANTVQRCMTLSGSELMGAAGYASMWVVANSILALWYAWVGDTNLAYEPL